MRKPRKSIHQRPHLVEATNGPLDRGAALDESFEGRMFAIDMYISEAKSPGYTIGSMAKEQCARRIALLEDIRTAIAGLMQIHNDEVQTLLKQDFGAIAELKMKLGAASAHKAELIELYREHVTSHGC